MEGNMEIYDSRMDFIFAFEFAFPGTRTEKVYKGAKFKVQTQSPLSWLEFCKKWAQCFIFEFWVVRNTLRSDLSKMDQTWSKWISHQSKNVAIKSCHIYRKNKNGCFVFDFFGSDLSKMDQTWSNWISHQSKNVAIKSCHIYRKDKNACYVFDFFGSDLSKMDQIGFLTNLKILQ